MTLLRKLDEFEIGSYFVLSFRVGILAQDNDTTAMNVFSGDLEP
jgi:hypothetical protein